MIEKKLKKLFRKNFFEKCCRLICEFKPDNKPKYLIDKKYKNNKPEDLVTYFNYVEKIKQIAYERKINIECGSNQKSGNNYKFKNPDITFSNLSNSMRTFFECKILGENSKYISNGIKRFIVEDYGFPAMPFYGMLGYVKDDSAINKHKKLKRSIENKKKSINLINQNLIKNSNNEVIFKTRHKTNKSIYNKKIFMVHILHSWD